MREQLIAYIDKLFEGTVDSQAARDFHDELLQNTIDRFDEELSGGRTEEEAYRIAVLSIGNTEELLKPFYPKSRNTGAYRGVAIALYCTSFLPIIFLSAISDKLATAGVAMMFLMIAAATMLMILTGRAKPDRDAENARTMRAVGVGMIIASLSALMIGVTYEELRVARLIPVDGAVFGFCGMIGLIAAGIAMLVTAGQRDRSRTVPQVPVTREAPKTEAPQKQETPSQPEMKPAIPKWVRIVGGILTGFYWLFAVIFYVWITVSTKAWYYTWLVFVFAGGVYSIISAIVRLCCGVTFLERLLDGIIDLLAGVAYYVLTLRTGMWYVTWLVFPIAGCFGGVIKGIIRLIRSTTKEVE